MIRFALQSERLGPLLPSAREMVRKIHSKLSLQPAESKPPNSVTTGTKSGASSAGRPSTPARAALRHAKRCWGEMPCRRATSDTTAPDAYDSAMIRPLTSSLHRRRRPAPTWISTRPRGFEASNICSTIYANRTVCDGLYLARQLAPDKVGAENRFPLTAGNSTPICW